MKSKKAKGIHRGDAKYAKENYIIGEKAKDVNHGFSLPGQKAQRTRIDTDVKKQSKR